MKRKSILDAGAFCKIYGDTSRNRIMEHFLALRESDVQVSEFISLLGLSKPTVYSEINNVLKEGLIIKSRIVGRTQLYKLDKNSKIIKILIKSFDDCLKYADKNNLEEELPRHSASVSKAMVMSAKHC